MGNSFNIHEDGSRPVIREEENPQAKLIASARNDKLFDDGADVDQLAKQVCYLTSGQEGVSKAFRLVVLPENWSSAPWDSLEEIDQPQNWEERLPLLVPPVSPDEVGPTFGPWLRDHRQARRNAVRFLLPQAGSTNIYHDRLDPELRGVAVAGNDGPAVVSWWSIKTEGKDWEHRTFVQPLAVSTEGSASRSWSATVPTHPLQRQPGPHSLSLEQRRELLHDTLEPMIRRELNHRGLVPTNGGYSSKLIGWVEVGGEMSC